MSLEKLARQYQHQFQDKFKNSILSIDGAIFIDGVKFSVQGKHYYDVTLHYLQYERPTLVCDETLVRIQNQKNYFLKFHPCHRVQICEPLLMIRCELTTEFLFMENWRCKTKFIEQINLYRLALMQHVDARFGTTVLAVQRSLKSAFKVWIIMMNQQRDTALSSYTCLEHGNHGSVLQFPVLEAVVDAFEELYHMTVRLEVSKYPSIHLALPSLFNCIQKLDSIANGGRTYHDWTASYIHPSHYPNELARLLSKYLKKTRNSWLVDFGSLFAPVPMRNGVRLPFSTCNEYRAHIKA